MTQAEAHRQFEAIKENGILKCIEAAAKRHGFRTSIILGLGSRETNLTNEIGDGGHGVGVLQIDTRYHGIAAREKGTGHWLHAPGVLIDYGVSLLHSDLAWAISAYPHYDQLKIALSAYNAGRGGAVRGIEQASNSDHFTTGGNYAEDVIARAEFFKRELG